MIGRQCHHQTAATAAAAAAREEARTMLVSLPAEAILLGGPTASGKSAVALELAERLDAEIVSVDSMQVYRGMDIGTAKPSAAERRRVHHHAIDMVHINEPYSVARFLTEAQQAVREITARGRRPLFCGGTGLYFKALLGGLEAMPAPDPGLRAELESTPLNELLAELAASDPVAFGRVDRLNSRRVVRAVEILRLRAHPAGGSDRAWMDANEAGAWTPPFLGLRRSAADLRARAEARVEAMFERGLVDETRRLLEQGLGDSRTALQAIGYRQVVEHLRGERTLAETVDRVKERTWQLVRRQNNWFIRHLPVDWLDVEADEPAGATARRAVARLRTLQIEREGARRSLGSQADPRPRDRGAGVEHR